MYRLFYVSTAEPGVDNRTVREMAEEARAKNERLGITGALVFNGLNFGQVLEGEQTVVKEMLDQIRRDPRHSGLKVIGEKKVSKRHFESWDMQLIESLDFKQLYDSMAED